MKLNDMAGIGNTWQAWVGQGWCRLKATSRFGLVLNGLVVLVGALLLRKAWCFPPMEFDAVWFHLPFASRLGGVIPAQDFQWLPYLNAHYYGYPLLANILQGLLWRLTDHVQAAALVNLGMLVVYVAVLRKWFGVPVALATFALLSVPMVLIHATSCYISLFAHLSAAMVWLALWRYGQATDRTEQNRWLGLIIVSAAVALNSKFVVLPYVTVALLMAVACWLRYRFVEVCQPQLSMGACLRAFVRHSARGVLIGVLLVPVLYFPCLKNLVSTLGTPYAGNPLFPLDIHVLGLHLAGVDASVNTLPNPSVRGLPKLAQWAVSVFELRQPVPFDWSVNGCYRPFGCPKTGGFFGAYMGVHLLLLAVQVVLQVAMLPGGDRRHRWRNWWRGCSGWTVLLFGTMTLLFIALPRNHMMRYNMVWAITLVSLNVLLLTGWVRARHAGLSGDRLLRLLVLPMLGWFMLVNYLTEYRYLAPSRTSFFYDAETYNRVLYRFPLHQLKTAVARNHVPGQLVCIPPVHAAILYTAYFNPDIRPHYRLQVGCPLLDKPAPDKPAPGKLLRSIDTPLVVYPSSQPRGGPSHP
ncbi:MAG: hypothetical protein KC475_10025 [Cyanobacteria bacterium HKST-UBA03]|nr:hypothetical protein [Cyanobacteria bacterium HKST-UBA03]